MPTATVCSTEFVALGRTEAEALGLATLPIAVIQHPLGGLKRDQVQARAHSAVETVQQLLPPPRQQLKIAS